LQDAERYFQEHLSVGDYYSENQAVADSGSAKARRCSDCLETHTITNSCACARISIHRPANDSRCGTKPPAARWERTAPNVKAPIAACSTISHSHRPSLCPITALVGHDPRIFEAHEQAVTAALSQLESFAATRVRKNGQCTARATGNVVAAVFRHETSRALDPHLHSHCILFNATHDPVENQWKALENYEMLVAIKFIEGLYYHELAARCADLATRSTNKPRGDF